MIEWTAELDDLLANLMHLTDEEIAREITLIVETSVSPAAVRIRRLRLGLLKAPAKGRGWTSKWDRRGGEWR